MKINFDKVKSFLDWQKIILILSLLISFFGFLNFETAVILKIIMVVFILIAGFYIYLKNKSEFLVIIIFFLTFFDIYNLYFSLSLPLWAVMLLAGLAILGIFYLAVPKEVKILSSYAASYALLLALVILEIFLALIPWPTDPKSKAVVLLAVFYLFSNIILLKIKGDYKLGTIISYAVVALIVMAIAISTTHWQIRY